MSGDETHIVTQREEFLLDRVDQVPMIAARKVGATDGALKEYVAHLGQTLAGMEEHHMPRCVTRAMEHLKLLLANGDDIALIEPACRLEGADRRKAEHLALFGQPLKQKVIVAVRADDGHSQPFHQIRACAHMIQMTVGQEDALRNQFQSGDERKDALRFAAWIDDGGTPGALAPEERAVLLERGDWKDAEIHGDG